MHPLSFLSVAATVAIAWLPGGLIHLGARQVNPTADAPVLNLIDTIRTTTVARVAL